MKGLLFLVLICSSLPAFGATSVVWNCGGSNLEGMNVTNTDGVLLGGVSWDCFHGGGICEQRSFLRLSLNQKGDAVYEGPYFKLTIINPAASVSGKYRGYIAATDMTSPSGSGRGFQLGEFVSCSREE